MWISKGMKLCGYDLCGQAVDREDERTWNSLFVMFVDLKKAYDSVPRNALWTVLAKYGVCLLQC